MSQLERHIPHPKTFGKQSAAAGQDLRAAAEVWDDLINWNILSDRPQSSDI